MIFSEEHEHQWAAASHSLVAEKIFWFVQRKKILQNLSFLQVAITNTQDEDGDVLSPVVHLKLPLLYVAFTSLKLVT